MRKVTLKNSSQIWKKNYATIFLITSGKTRTLFLLHINAQQEKSNIIWNLNWIWCLFASFFFAWGRKRGKAEENICRCEIVIQLTTTSFSQLYKEIEWNWSMGMTFLPKRLFTCSLRIRERNKFIGSFSISLLQNTTHEKLEGGNDLSEFLSTGHSFQMYNIFTVNFLYSHEYFDEKKFVWKRMRRIA